MMNVILWPAERIFDLLLAPIILVARFNAWIDELVERDRAKHGYFVVIRYAGGEAVPKRFPDRTAAEGFVQTTLDKGTVKVQLRGGEYALRRVLGARIL